MRMDGQDRTAPFEGAGSTVPGVSAARMITPEAVAIELDTAGLGSRLLAGLIDAVLLWVGLFVLGLALWLTGLALDSVGLPTWLIVAFALLLLSCWMLGYFIVQETFWRGRTVGKAALGLRVVTREGGPIRFRHALVRGLLGLVDFWALSGAVAVISVLATPANQRLGDLAAGTLVLRERTGSAQARAVAFVPPRGLEHYTALLDTAGIGAPEYQAVRSFLLRRPLLTPAARQALAGQLASQLAARVSPPAPPGTGAEDYLAAVAAAYQSRQRSAPAARYVPVPAPPPAQAPQRAPLPPAGGDGGFAPPA